jgi:hypothetical protein
MYRIECFFFQNVHHSEDLRSIDFGAYQISCFENKDNFAQVSSQRSFLPNPTEIFHIKNYFEKLFWNMGGLYGSPHQYFKFVETCMFFK